MRMKSVYSFDKGPGDNPVMTPAQERDVENVFKMSIIMREQINEFKDNASDMANSEEMKECDQTYKNTHYEDKENLRQIQREHGFITPNLMNKTEFKFSMVTSKAEENLLRKEQLKNCDSSDEGSGCFDRFSLSKTLITKEDSVFSIFWRFLDAFSCIVSSYLFVFMATFSDFQVGETLYHVAIGFEILFFLSMVKCFFTEYTPEGQTHSVKSLSLIAKNYIAKGFWLDLIAIVPIPFVFRGYHELIKLFYLLKIVRMTRGIELFEGSAFMGAVKKLSQKRMEKQIEEDPIFAEDYINDHTNIERLLFISYGIKTIKLIILIMNISYFVGMIWLIYSEITMDILVESRHSLSAEEREFLHNDFFIT